MTQSKRPKGRMICLSPINLNREGNAIVASHYLHEQMSNEYEDIRWTDLNTRNLLLPGDVFGFFFFKRVKRSGGAGRSGHEGKVVFHRVLKILPRSEGRDIWGKTFNQTSNVLSLSKMPFKTLSFEKWVEVSGRKSAVRGTSYITEKRADILEYLDTGEDQKEIVRKRERDDRTPLQKMQLHGRKRRRRKFERKVQLEDTGYIGEAFDFE